MTIVISQINEFGIVFAADRNITWLDSNTRFYKPHSGSPRRKLVSIKEKGAARLGLVVGYFGLAEILMRSGRSVWLDDLIAEVGSAAHVSSIEDLSAELAARVQDALNESDLREEERGVGFHIGGFVEPDSLLLPTFRYLSNFTREHDRKLPRVTPGARFNGQGEDHFLGRDAAICSPHNLGQWFEKNWFAMYYNGMLVIHNAVLDSLKNAFNAIWPARHTYPGELLGFEPPDNLEKHRRLVELCAKVTRDFFDAFSAHPGKPIGGDIDTVTISLDDGLKEYPAK